ncbi:histidine phosphatase family protein [Azorhizobium sp. AG788]|uniref:histidine phosphatase family protein n=1 Tax=Azorhizobium sp. AG788 TaxID=2183897 RepID=UPI00313A1C75
MTTLIMTRHGHVPGISPARFRGRVEVDLSPTGEAQAAALAERIAACWQPAAIYTSPLGRCVATGARIALATSCAAVAHAALADIDYGAWQWKTHGEAQAQAPELFAQWHAAPQRVRFPGGESLQDVMVRAADLVRDLLARHRDETVVLVGHDSSNRVLLAHLLDLPLSHYWRLGQEPCNLTVVEAGGDQAKLLRLNETAHLDGIAAP